MMSELALEQVFVRPKGGRLELLLVLENLAGARFRETLVFPTRNELEAVRRAAKHLAYRGDVSDVSRLRLRLERGGLLTDNAELKRAFVSEFVRHLEVEES